MQQISTSEFSTRKQVEIDGHHYTVRRMGAGDQLDLQRLMREIEVLEKKVLAPGYKEDSNDLLEMDRLTDGMINIYVQLFQDHADGKKSDALIRSLSWRELGELIRQIFGDEPLPEATKPTTEVENDSQSPPASDPAAEAAPPEADR